MTRSVVVLLCLMAAGCAATAPETQSGPTGFSRMVPHGPDGVLPELNGPSDLD